MVNETEPTTSARVPREEGPALLDVDGLTVSLVTDRGRIEALTDLSFGVREREVVALVGESGSGKTVTALSLLRILPAGSRIERGHIRLGGVDVVSADESELTRLRGGRVGMVFQEPMTALNPVYTVGDQINEAIRLHADVSRKEAKARSIEWLKRVGMPEPERRYASFPHELSGGMRQRVLIAMALAPGPKLLVADEPTTALDRSVEAQILELLLRLVDEEGMSMLFISHDLAVVSEIADRTLVMYAGEIVEAGPTDRVVSAPRHPYTRALVDSVLALGTPRERHKKRRPLPTIRGAAPSLTRPPTSCRFASRCPKRMPRCEEKIVPFYPVDQVEVRCFLYDISSAPPSKRALVLDDDVKPSLELEDE